MHKATRYMKYPESDTEILLLHNLRNSHPRRYVAIANKWVADNPSNSNAYFGRHIAWMNLGRPDRALADLDKVISLKPDGTAFRSRGDIYRRLGDYARALEDLSRGEAMDPKEWDWVGYGLLSQAECHARLGDEAAALACCARLPDDFWTPGIEGAPAGGKAEIANQLRLLAAQARGAAQTGQRSA
jgi:tetratricopeptide (TPR) repeat protein